MKRLFLLFFLLIPYSIFQILDSRVSAAPSTEIKNTLSSSQLSYFARIGTGTTAGSTSLNIELSGNPSNTTANLFVGDTIAIANTSDDTTLSKYVVTGIGDTGTISLSPSLDSDNEAEELAVIATRSAIHTVSFKPQTQEIGALWQVLIKATDVTAESENDGIPDQDGFDLGKDDQSATGLGSRLKTADVTCPWSATASVGTTAVVDGSSYHVIQCALGAGVSNPVDATTTITIGRDLATGSQLINPAPAVDHTEGQADSSADTYTFYVRALDSGGNLIPNSTARGVIAVVESVRVTATVDPTITFTIGTSGVTAGNTVCGNLLDTNANDTTSTSASFGSLSLGQANDLAHHLSCVTNAGHGYVVTVYEADQMVNVSSGTGTTIPDTICDGSCDYNTTDTWTDTDDSGWGYSIESIDVGETIFDYNSGYRAFGVGSGQAQEIFKNTSTPTATEDAYICYRLVVSTTQEAGNYENQLVYTATATF